MSDFIENLILEKQKILNSSLPRGAKRPAARYIIENVSEVAETIPNPAARIAFMTNVAINAPIGLEKHALNLWTDALAQLSAVERNYAIRRAIEETRPSSLFGQEVRFLSKWQEDYDGRMIALRGWEARQNMPKRARVDNPAP
jgi:hypothetical protein